MYIREEDETPYLSICPSCDKELPSDKPARCQNCSEWLLGEVPNLYRECFKEGFRVENLMGGAMQAFRAANQEDHICWRAKDMFKYETFRETTRSWLSSQMEDASSRLQRCGFSTEEGRQLQLLLAYLRFLMSLTNPRNHDGVNRELIAKELERWVEECTKPVDKSFFASEIAECRQGPIKSNAGRAVLLVFSLLIVYLIVMVWDKVKR